MQQAFVDLVKVSMHLSASIASASIVLARLLSSVATMLKEKLDLPQYPIRFPFVLPTTMLP